MGGEIHSFGFNLVYQVTQLEGRVEAGSASLEEVRTLFSDIDSALAADPGSRLLQEQKERAVSLAGRFDAHFVKSEVDSICQKTSSIVAGHLGHNESKMVIEEAQSLIHDHALSLKEQARLSTAMQSLTSAGINVPLTDKSAVEEGCKFGESTDLEASENLFYMGEMLFTGQIKAFFTSFNTLDQPHQSLFNAHLERRGVSLMALNSNSIGPAYHNNVMGILQALERTCKHLAIGQDPQAYQSLETIEEIFEEAQAY